jgi:SulP family sulfate permease
MLRVGGSLFFGAADHVERRLLTLSEQIPDQRHLLLVGTGMNFVDMAGAEVLARGRLTARNWRQLVVSGSEHAFTRLLNIRAP